MIQQLVSQLYRHNPKDPVLSELCSNKGFETGNIVQGVYNELRKSHRR